MDKTTILDFIKKNAFALCCGLVTIAALVAAYYPIGGMVTALSTKATEEASPYQQLTNFLHSRKFPQVDPTRTAPLELTSFPTKDQVEAGKAAVAKLASESAASADVLANVNGERVHTALVPDSLPSPLSDTPKFTFAEVYKKVLSLDPTMSGLGSPTVPPPVQANPVRQQATPMPVDERLASVRAVNLCNDILRAGVPADAKLLAARQAWLKTNVYDQRLAVDNSGVAVNAAEVQQAMAADFLQLPQKLNEEIAARSNVYLDVNAFGVNASILSAANPQMSDIWFAQLSLWVQTDVAKAVAAANAGLDSVSAPPASTLEAPVATALPSAGGAPTTEPALRGVPASPVKRILRLDMKPIPMYQFATANGGPTAADETAAQPAVYTASPTGRTSNAMYDVVPFRLTVDVEADHVNQFIETLCRDRLIYVYNQDVYTIDASTLTPQGYIYGSKPVVRLILSGEELFLRKWSKLLMPLRIQYLLGLATPPPGSHITPLGGGGPVDTGGMQSPDGGMMPPGMPPPGGM